MELHHRVSKGTPLSNVVVMSNLTLNSGPINGINIKNAYHTICSCIRNTSTLNYIFQPCVLSLLLHLSLPFLCPGLLVRLLCRLYFKHLLREERSVAWKKPNRSLQGLRIIGKVKYLGMDRRGGAKKKSFHPSSPDEEFCSCQKASQGVWGMTLSR